MPELPEVETIKRDLQERIIGRQIIDVVVYDRRVIRNGTVVQFKKNLKDKIFKDVERKGKAIVCSFAGAPGYLVVQPMMTGQLIFCRDRAVFKTTKVAFRLSNHLTLHYNDQRLFGRLQFVRDLREIKFFQSMGPDPLSDELSVEHLAARLKGRQMPIKTLLMDQSFVAGIGNIYACEILFHAGIHPVRKANSLTLAELSWLHRMTRKVLNEAVQFRGTSMNTYRDLSGQKGRFLNRVKVYGRKDKKCLRCQGSIERIVLSGRSTFFCRHCQPINPKNFS